MKCPGQLEHEQDSYISWSMLFYPSSMHVELTRPEMGQIMLNLLDSQSMCTNYAATSRHDITVIWIRPLTYLWIWSQTGSDYQSVAQYSLVTTLSNELRTGHDHKSPLVICPVISKWCPPNWRPFPVNFMIWPDWTIMLWYDMAWKARLLLVLKGAGTLVYGYCLMYTVAHHVINYVVVSAACRDSILLHAVWSTCINHPELESETHCIMHGLYSHSCTCNVLYCSFAQYIYTCTYS